MATEVHTIQVPGGSFTGKVIGNAVQFYNIPFGTYSKRFTAAKMATISGHRDCTVQGPLCPQDTPYRDSYLGIPESKVHEFDFVCDEFQCLNLMITMPRKIPAEPMPVVVWVHGGGNSAGTAYRGVNNPINWVNRGIETGKSFIVVTIQYRVHFFGFLPFKGQGNWGQLDQLLATDWVHKYIEHFGGDNKRITVAGQSSGSYCVWNLSCHSTAKFKQAAYLSGSLKGTSTRTLEEYSVLIKKICNVLNCTEEELQTCPWQELVRAYRELGLQVLMQCDDGQFLPKGSWHLPPTKMERVLISDCINDGQFFTDGLEKNVLAAVLKPKIPEVVQKVYPVETDEQAVRLLTDFIFALGNDKADNELRPTTKVFRQLFDAVNPVNPELGNIHMVELLYLLHAYELKPEFVEVAHKLQDMWIQFIYFENPWNPDEEFLHVGSELSLHSRDHLENYRAIHKFPVLDNDEVKRSRDTISGW